MQRGDRDPRSAPVDDTRRGALWIALAYALIGTIWILLSDRALEALVTDGAVRAQAQTVKGWFYVLVTAVLLYLAIARLRAGLAARDRRLRAVLDTMLDGVIVFDRCGRIVEANPAAAEIMGTADPALPDGELSQLLVRSVVRHPDGRPARPEETAAWRALNGETIDGWETLVRRADGRDVFLTVSAVPLVGHGGEPELAVVAIRDVSEVKRFEAMREEFLATAAHELKTPLAVVKAYAQLMQRRGQGDPSALSAITRQTDRLHRIVQQLLEVSRFRVGGGELRRERFDLGTLAEEVVADMPGTRGRVVIAREPGAAVNGDRERIGQVVAALLENALRFSPGGGEVETSIARLGSDAVLSVRDRGVGIAPERQARVFERFYRAHVGTPEDYGGLGLGLDVSREIVARHGGRIWFESEQGRGSTFSFSLPLAEDAS